MFWWPTLMDAFDVSGGGRLKVKVWQEKRKKIKHIKLAETQGRKRIKYIK